MDRRRFAALTLLIATTSLGAALAAEHDDVAMTLISLDDVSQALDDKNWVIVDTRASDAYNGWKLDGVKRGGHLPGAVDFPSDWLDSEQEHKEQILSQALSAKGIEPHRKIVLYSLDERERNRVASYLVAKGYRQLHEFDLKLWIDDPNKPLVRYPNFHLIVPPFIVKQLLDGQSPETFAGGKRVLFAEASWGNEDASYSKGHVPGSFHVNTDHFEPPPAWMLGDPIVLGQFANRYGFQADDTVIVSGADPTAAYRLAIVLRYLGVRDVRALNGGFAAWKNAGYEVESKSNQPPGGAEFGVQIPGRPNLIDDIATVKAALHTPHEFTLVDTRTWAEFIGQTSGYSYHNRKGRIAGTVYGQAGFKGKNSLVPYRNIDNTMRNADEIRGLWQSSGIDVERHLSFMCGSGWRAAEVLTFAQVMGLADTSLFSDGWIGWSNDPENPVESGGVAAETQR